MSIELYDHNKETYSSVVKMFNNHNRVAIVQPTGTGKSFIYLKWIEDNPDDIFVVFSPSTEIFSQMERYTEETNDKHILEKTTFITFQRLLKMSLEELKKLKPTKIIIDEIQRTGAEEWEIVLFQFLTMNPSALILGGTATPVRYLDNARNMAEELFDNNIARYMTLGEAVAKEILPMPEYVPVYYDFEDNIEKKQQRVASMIKNKTDRQAYYDSVAECKRNLEKSYGADKMFKEYMHNTNGKYIVFCKSIEHLYTMIPILKKWLTGISEKVHSYISTATNDRSNTELHLFIEDKTENSIKLLFSVDRFNEGLHVPDIDGVILLRPTISPIIYLQQMGRALACGKHKTPVIFDLVNNFESVTVIDGEGNKTNVFVNEYLKYVSKSQKENIEKFGLLTRELNFNSLYSQLVNVLEYDYDVRWEYMYNLLVEYIAHKNRLPKQTEIYKEENIGVWVNNQRSFYKKGRLSQEKIDLLEKVGFVFDAIENQWQTMYNLLVEYIAHKNRLPKNREFYKDKNLGNWVNNQRSFYKKGKLSQEKIDLLEKVGFVFDVKENQWQKMYDILVEYIAIENKLPTMKKVYKEKNIGVWVTCQRSCYKKGRLSQEKIDLLEKVGVVFDIYENQWQEMYNLYLEFVANKKREPKNKETYKDKNLGSWVNNQRTFYKKGRLSQEKIDLLEKVGFVFDAIENQWQTMYNLLVEYIANENRIPKREETYKEKNIGTWVSNQKKLHNKGKLKQERTRKLKEIGVI